MKRENNLKANTIYFGGCNFFLHSMNLAPNFKGFDFIQMKVYDSVLIN